MKKLSLEKRVELLLRAIKELNDRDELTVQTYFSISAEVMADDYINSKTPIKTI